VVLATRRISLRQIHAIAPKTTGSLPGGRGFIRKESSDLYALGRFLDRQGRLTGDLNRIQNSILAYVMKRERDEQFEILDNDFKNMVFVHNPEMYKRIYHEDKEDEIEMIVPESEADVQDMLAELKESGIFLDVE
jgi:hypothetical protein